MTESQIHGICDNTVFPRYYAPRYNASMHITRVGYEPELPHTVRQKSMAMPFWGLNEKIRLINSQYHHKTWLVGVYKNLKLKGTNLHIYLMS